MWGLGASVKSQCIYVSVLLCLFQNSVIRLTERQHPQIVSSFDSTWPVPVASNLALATAC